jgi:hypothetical protein
VLLNLIEVKDSFLFSCFLIDLRPDQYFCKLEFCITSNHSQCSEQIPYYLYRRHITDCLLELIHHTVRSTNRVLSLFIIMLSLPSDSDILELFCEVLSLISCTYNNKIVLEKYLCTECINSMIKVLSKYSKIF